MKSNTDASEESISAYLFVDVGNNTVRRVRHAMRIRGRRQTHSKVLLKIVRCPLLCKSASLDRCLDNLTIVLQACPLLRSRRFKSFRCKRTTTGSFSGDQ